MFGVVTVVVGAVGCGLVIVAAQRSIGLAIAVAVVFVIGTLLLGVYQAALSGVYSAAWYRYATLGEAPAGFETLQLEPAFADK